MCYREEFCTYTIEEESAAGEPDGRDSVPDSARKSCRRKAGRLILLFFSVVLGVVAEQGLKKAGDLCRIIKGPITSQSFER